MNKWMKKFFMYLDRYHVQHNNLPSLADAGIAAFKRYVFDEIHENVTNALLETIDRERCVARWCWVGAGDNGCLLAGTENESIKVSSRSVWTCT
jgi:hypothetical protein